METLQSNLLERFLRYVKIDTMSNQENADKGISPSTETQRDFAKQLATELKSMGIKEVKVTESAYVYAQIPATKNCMDAPSIAFCSHMDTVPGVSGKDVKPLIKEKDGDTIITSDGTTLLGADDKAGIAEIITAVEHLLNEKTEHGQIEILFSPDEETGHGMDTVPLHLLQSKICYTLDGSEAGEIESECFNAYKATIHFTGIPKHTGTARPDMVNAVTMASNFVSLLPQTESPEATDGYQGFYAPMSIEGNLEKACVVLYLRDFDTQGMQERIENIEHFAKTIEKRFKGSHVQVVTEKQYVNMKEKLDKNPQVMQMLIQAVKNLGITPIFKPIRGGTDGSKLTEMGIPCPNIFTGGHNFHALGEWASLNQMVLATKTVLELIRLYSKEK